MRKDHFIAGQQFFRQHWKMNDPLYSRSTLFFSFFRPEPCTATEKLTNCDRARWLAAKHWYVKIIRIITHGILWTRFYGKTHSTIHSFSTSVCSPIAAFSDAGWSVTTASQSPTTAYPNKESFAISSGISAVSRQPMDCFFCVARWVCSHCTYNLLPAPPPPLPQPHHIRCDNWLWSGKGSSGNSHRQYQ